MTTGCARCDAGIELALATDSFNAADRWGRATTTQFERRQAAEKTYEKARAWPHICSFSKAGTR